LLRNSIGTRPLGKPGRKREDDSNVNVKKVVSVEGAWIELVQDRVQWQALVLTALNLRLLLAGT
jgi:hypothetical protein